MLQILFTAVKQIHLSDRKLNSKSEKTTDL